MLTIGVVAKQSGIGIHTLRKWEIRYGFPSPLRSPSGQRIYTSKDLERLIAISRLLDSGVTVKKAIGNIVKNKSADICIESDYSNEVHAIANALINNQIGNFYRLIEQSYTNYNLSSFVNQVSIPLIGLIGDAWQAGRLSVYCEHVFANCMSELLSRNSAKNYKENNKFRILLSTPAQERHFLGIEMLSALLIDKGYPIIKLGPDLPNNEIILAADSYQVSIIALSVSVHYPQRLLKESLLDLRDKLPQSTKIWVGGSGAQKIDEKLAGITIMQGFEDALERLK